MGLFGKKTSTPPPPVVEPPPEVASSDLTRASQLMDRWDAAMGNSDAIYDCLEAIARQGGWRGEDETMTEAVRRGGDASTVVQRPWRWWQAAAEAAQAAGEDGLAGRIFLFTHMYATQLAPKMDWRAMASVGLDPPRDESYKGIAASAVGSLVRLDPSFLIHDTATGRVDVAGALQMAEQVSGVVAPTTATSPPIQHESPHQAGSADDPFNSL